jgi:hypothetical protein
LKLCRSASALLLGALAATGRFGVVTFLVTRWTREIGIRRALAATLAGILRLMLAPAGRWTALGLAQGCGRFARCRAGVALFSSASIRIAH